MEPFRFSLRTLIVVLLLGGAGIGMFVVLQSERQQLLRRMERAGTFGFTRITAPYGDSLARRFCETQLQSDDPEDLRNLYADARVLAGRKLSALPELRSILLEHATDADLEGLAGIDRLEELCLVDYRGTAAGLRTLSAHHRLSRLIVPGRLTATELEALGAIPAIHSLWVEYAKIDLEGAPVTNELIRAHLGRVEQGQLPCVVQAVEDSRWAVLCGE
jgi:hypothetical protein